MESYAESPVSGPVLSDAERALLARAQEIADTLLAPCAQAVDRSGEPPRENIAALAEAGLLGITTPREWGGHGVSSHCQRAFTEILTAACGTTWFILTQHLGACGQIASSRNPSLRERFLRDMAAGRHLVGVAFGHLRRPQPMLRAEPVDGGWSLTGVAPWVTGWPLLAGVIYGAVLPDDRFIHLYAPARESERVQSSPPLPLCAMNASATTEVHLDNLFIPDEDFVKYSSREEMTTGDTRNIAGAIAPPIGCARGSLRVLQTAAERRNIPFLLDAAAALAAEIEECRAEGNRWADGPKDVPEYKPNALRARAWAIDLGVRAAHMAVAASSGAANSLDHPAQRLLREAMFYTVIAQTQDTMAATLERLSHPSPATR